MPVLYNTSVFFAAGSGKHTWLLDHAANIGLVSGLDGNLAYAPLGPV